MKRENQHIKPYMQILSGIALIVVYKLTENPVAIITKWKDSNSYNPEYELFFLFLSWASLIGSICLFLIATAQLISRKMSPK